MSSEQSRNEEPLPKTQRAAVYHEHNGQISVEEIPVPEVGADDLLVKVLFTGVCHTDLHVWMGDLPIESKEPPIVGGHEGVGVVVRVGANVRDFRVGDRAGIQWINGSCLRCEQCRRGFTQSCARALLSGCTRDGSFQQYALVKAANAAHIDASIRDLANVAPILCAGVTVYAALRESGARDGDTVAITGAGGGLGSLCIQYARALRLRVLAIDARAKEEHCRRMGAEWFVAHDARGVDVVAEVRRQTDGAGPHAVVCLATAETPMNQACEYVRTRGSVVLVALPKGACVRVDVFQAVSRSITLKGSYVGNRQDTEEALGFFARGQVSIPVEVEPLSHLPRVFERMRAGQISGRVVLDLWK